MTQTYRSRSALITAAVMLVFAAMIVGVNVSAVGWREASVGVGIAVALACGATAFYIRPSVVVHEDRVELRNVTHRAVLGYDRLIMVDTRWAMALAADDGTAVSAWAAPAPGSMAARRTRAEDLQRLPPNTYVEGSARVGDRPGTASGDAALLVRVAWHDWREANPDALPASEQPAIHRSPDLINIALIVAGVAAVVAGLLL